MKHGALRGIGSGSRPAEIKLETIARRAATPPASPAVKFHSTSSSLVSSSKLGKVITDLLLI